VTDPSPLAVLGLGVYLPPTVSVPEWAAAHGAEVHDFKGWARACHAGPDDHPSTMGAKALRVALDRAGVGAGELRLVVYSGASRDYVPSWSVASELMHLCGASDACVGLDMTAGCLATVAALDLAQGWLAVHGGGVAAVVAAERWSQTIDYADPTTVNLWGYGDSAAAVVVGAGVNHASRVDFLGAEFRSAAANNGHVFVPYGGTRVPVAPPGVDPFARQVSDRPKEQVLESYRRGYRDAYDALRKRFDLEPARLVCNQTSPSMVAMIADVLAMEGREVVTGHDFGHLGGPDVVVGLDRVIEGGDGEVILMGASAAFGFGTAFFSRPSSTRTSTPGHASP
jgi:3-oxoacyl-[acyl-carrier-protein] synthase-3